ncbi:helix-turn-helix transcriptional regulator [Corynebacterium qintianiae]|uniref:Helix-turn-helix transcriptional regulator n=1 Tax=Corynebacterium qintianiae TaxID=2709392 RepID=A0A7T0KPS6_9CORY|nr:helix-turn-helix transcriptional regulator [Corynebacterium qintianiae]QPK83793.1 helix-turn-helix transcriptional regulator [Corynebacterium qintianiae]
MSVKYSLLTLLNEQPRSAKRLQTDLDAEMHGFFALNIGQVSQTLSRLVREGLARTTTSVSEATGRDVEVYELTASGRDELNLWWDGTVTQPGAARDELVIKFALAARRQENVDKLLDAQRFATLADIRELTRATRSLPEERTAERLNIERQIFELEAVMRWLDRVEALQPPKEA